MTMTKYGVILADPPWSYDNVGVNAAADKHYSTMSVVDIGNLPVGDIAMDDSVLILWSTWPMVDVAIDIMRNWGFAHVTGFPWIKVTNVARNLFDDQIEFDVLYGVGFWVRGCSEPILIGRKGNPNLPNGSPVGILSPNTFHSRKPYDIYRYAESLEGPYCELFARRKQPGWDGWGNEIESDFEFGGQS
jgi:N6-adenosine-specific RNA methylase IME4